MEKVLWLVLGGVTFVAALRAGASRQAMLVGRAALGALFLAGGAAVNALYLATGTDYSDFADGSYVPFVRDTWQSVVAPNQEVFIPLLVLFEAVAGLLVLSGGRRTLAGLLALGGFHLALLLFGWWFWLWAVPMLAAVGLLLRAELLHRPGQPTAGRRRSTDLATLGY